MQTRIPLKTGVPRVPGVPLSLKATVGAAFRGGTPWRTRRNTWCSRGKRCSTSFANVKRLEVPPLLGSSQIERYRVRPASSWNTLRGIVHSNARKKVEHLVPAPTAFTSWQGGTPPGEHRLMKNSTLPGPPWWPMGGGWAVEHKQAPARDATLWAGVRGVNG
ncbi:hypothetical protein D9M71_215300 [compost metagenome]